MPPEPGAAFVVISHLAPREPSMLPELLARKTAMPVGAATDAAPVEPNRVYVIAPNSTLILAGDLLRVETHSDPRANPIDTFFRSLAEARGPRAVGVVLSGTGSDGSLGLRAIKEHGGLVMAQEPESAKYDSMPRSAIAESLVDWVLPAAAMPARLTEYLSLLDGTGLAPGPPSLPADPGERESLLRQLCTLVQRKTGHDFSHYKRTTLLRRIERRMHVLQRPTFASYVELLGERPAEIEWLFQELLIGVTQFFRDPEVFELLAREILPRLVANRAPDDPVRVWVPGCATGEEAYSLAMLLSEALADSDLGVKIFATDIDEVALDVARAGRYPETIAAHVAPERLSRHFVPRQDGGWQVGKGLREMCVFSSHNVTSAFRARARARWCTTCSTAISRGSFMAAIRPSRTWVRPSAAWNN
jgi:two-component system CheB/CheR fusion protein